MCSSSRPSLSHSWFPMSLASRMNHCFIWSLSQELRMHEGERKSERKNYFLIGEPVAASLRVAKSVENISTQESYKSSRATAFLSRIVSLSLSLFGCLHAKSYFFVSWRQRDNHCMFSLPYVLDNLLKMTRLKDCWRRGRVNEWTTGMRMTFQIHRRRRRLP